MQDTQVRSLIRDGPRSHGVTQPVHTYWAWVLEPVLCHKRSGLDEKPVHRNDQAHAPQQRKPSLFFSCSDIMWPPNGTPSFCFFNMFLLSDTTTYSRLTLLFLFPKPGISHFFKELCLFLLEPKIWLLNVVIDIEVSLILDSHSGQN